MTHDQDVESTAMTDEQIIAEMDSAYWKARSAHKHPWGAAFAVAEKAIRERCAEEAYQLLKAKGLPAHGLGVLEALRNKDASYVAPGS